MNMVSFGLPEAAYFNIKAAGSDNWLDYTVAIAGEIFVDQKTMALFSALFGAGIVLFADRTQAKGRRVIWFSLWRNFLLLLIGVGHTLLWEGDVLVLYAICAPILIFTRRLPGRLLLAMGVVCVVCSAAIVAVAQASVPADGAGLGSYWLVDGGMTADWPGVAILADFFFRALGMMWIGVALYRMEILQGRRSADFYRRMARVGLGIGLPLAILGVVIGAVADYSPEVALIGQVPNTIATIPIALGYLGLITLWDKRPTTQAHERVRACGRMALTNYLMQTIIGVVVLGSVLGRGDLGRTALLGLVVAIWALQLLWSKPWLERFRFGPFEWAWRSLTYRKVQPLRR